MTKKQMTAAAADAESERFAAACRRVAAAAKTGGWKLALAESCTGGLIAAGLTEIAGASEWFALGIVSYANGAKTKLLGVPETVLAEKGAVSEETARLMCEGAMSHLRRIFPGGTPKMTVAITGIAGPSPPHPPPSKMGGGLRKFPSGMEGGTLPLKQINPPPIFDGGGGGGEKPVGTVCFAWQTETGDDCAENKDDDCIATVAKSVTIVFPGDRKQIRLQSAAYAMEKASAIMRGENN